MQRSKYEITCPQCAAGYVLPRGKGPISGTRKQMIRCSNCKSVFVACLKATSIYADRTSDQPEQSFIMGQSVPQKKSTPPAQVPSRPVAKMTEPPPTEYWQPRTKDRLRSTMSYRNPTLSSSVPPIPTSRNDRWTPPPSRTVNPPKFSPPQMKISPNRVRLGDITPMSTEIVDAFKNGSLDNLSFYKKHRIKKMLWLAGSIAGLCFCLIVPAVVLLPTTVAYEAVSARPNEADITPETNTWAPAPFSLLAAEPPIHASVTKGTLYHAQNSLIFIINGSVENSSSQNKNQVFVLGELLDSTGKVVSKTWAPCGMLHRYKLLSRTPADSIGNLYKINGNYYNCVLSSDGTKKYQIVFDEVPLTSNNGLTLRVRAFSAEEMPLS